MKPATESNSIKLEGNLTIEHAAELKNFLIKSMNHSHHLHLRFENIGEVDISFLQLLCSVHRTAVQNQKTILLDSQRPEPLKQAVIEGGFVRQEGCLLDVQHSCIWKEGWR